MLKKLYSHAIISIILLLLTHRIVAEEIGEKTVNYNPAKIAVTRERVKMMLESMDTKIVNGDKYKNKIDAITYSSYAIMIREWFKNPWMELDSMIAKSWYISVYNTFVRMAKIKRVLEKLESQHRDNSPAYKNMRKKFMVEYKKFKALQKKPTKITKTRYTELKRAKAIWEKKERAKAKAAARAKKRRR